MTHIENTLQIDADRYPLPSESLRHRVHGANDVDSFLHVGQQCAQDITAALQRIGRDLDSFESILDFGCGCGRVLRWIAPQSPAARLFGTDIDREAIAWCGKNLSGMAFAVNSGLPPLGYASNSFSLIYAISVFSHLNEEYQFYWLNELRRITQPEGIVLLSIHGSHYWDLLEPVPANLLQSQGILFTVSGMWTGIFPDWYQVAFHTKEYVLDNYSQYFDILDYIPVGMNGVQDLVVLQRKKQDYFILDKELASYNEIRKLSSQVSQLENTIEIKNKHILQLEKLLHDIEAGRVMRMLNMLVRK